MALIKDYLKKTEELANNYGEKSLVLMQVGAFYEVYGLYRNTSPEDETGTIELFGSNIAVFAKKCELAISKKTACVGKHQVAMAGFRDYMLDKYIKKLQDMGFTTAVYSQDEKAAGTTRSLTGIYSPGTFFSNDISDEKITNNTMCIWLQKFGGRIVCGISNIDIYTGKSLMFEYDQNYSKTPEAYDELEKYISIYTPSEVIIIHNLDDDFIEDIIKFSDIKTTCVHKHNIDTNQSKQTQRIRNCEKQVYQSEILKRYYGDLIEYDDKYINYPIATQSLCYLLDFIYTHNPNLVKKIEMPSFENKSDRLLLANQSLKQLNIINNGMVNSGKLSSLVSFLNCCMTPMGKRLFSTTLVNPICNKEKLNNEYAIQEHFADTVDESEKMQQLRSSLGNIKDIERIMRKMYLKRMTPADFYYLSQDFETILRIYKGIATDSLTIKYTTDFDNNSIIDTIIDNTIDNMILTIKTFLSTVLEIKLCCNVNNLDFDKNFIKRGYKPEHDKLVEEWMDSESKLEAARTYLNDFVKQYEKNKKNTDYVKIHSTEKSGFSLITTKRRSAILKNALFSLQKTGNYSQQGNASCVTLSYYSAYNQETKKMIFDTSSIEYKDANASNVSINNKDIRTLCDNIVHSRHKMVSSLTVLFKDIVEQFVKHHDGIEKIVQFVSRFDLLVARCFINKKYNYCCPKITSSSVSNENSDQESHVNVTGLRHPLIEQLLQRELYVTNDIVFDGIDTQGILLYGTNAVGKSSLIKALGMCVILAQSGFFVPCASFEYYPFKHIFTRILGNDNLFKGLSSFAVEMIEFKTILSQADKNSLVLGDELCSGTENNSAISIFVAGLDHLYKQNTKFIFATHFHEIARFEEIVMKKRLLLKHLAVHYDQEQDKLVYDRKLQDGPGESMYGLEVCKALKLPQHFLSAAHEIRNKYCKETSSMLDYKPSRYNAKKLRGICERCNKNFSTEVHHINHQKEANKDGFIGHFHKNHVANLASLCEECHLAEHQNENHHI